MEYRAARRTRKRSLLSLIGENKFERGEGLGKSIRHGISEKFQASATGLKEKLDPLNLVRGLAGNSPLGDWATQIAGRAMGRKQSDIEYFGGFSPYSKRTGHAMKDPLVATISSTDQSHIKKQEAIANIVGKMYNMMYQQFEKQQEHDKIAKDFRQEQMDEDDRRHQELIKAIQGGMPTATPAEEKEEKKSFLDSIMEFFKKNPIFDMLMQKGKDLLGFFKGPIWTALMSGLGAFGEMMLPLLPAAAVAAFAAAIFGTFVAANWFTKNWKMNQLEKASDQGGKLAQEAEIERQSYTGDSDEDVAGRQVAESKKASAIDRKNKFVAEYLETKGYKVKKGMTLNPFSDPNNKTYENEEGKTPPESLMKEAKTYADGQIDRVIAGEIPDPQKVYKLKPTTAGSGRGKQGAPTVQQATSMPASTPAVQKTEPVSTSAPAPAPLPKVVPDISPTPEPPTMFTQQQPQVSVMNKTNNIGSGKPKTISPVSPRSRNDDLDYYHDRITPSW